MEKTEKQRKSNFELLRIFAMVLIILHHYALHGGLSGIASFGVNKYIGTICLIGGNKAYWFMLPYICVYVLSPIINKLIKNITQKQLISLIGILTFMFSGIGFFISDSGLMNNLSWFILIYLIGAYIRLYDFNRFSKNTIKWFSVIGYVLFIIITCGITYMRQYNMCMMGIYGVGSIIEMTRDRIFNEKS